MTETIAIERALGSAVTRSVPAPWGSKNRTETVHLADGRQVVVQRYTDRDSARTRLHAAEQLAGPLNHHGVPVPQVLAYDLRASTAWAVFEQLPGEVAYVAAGHDLSGENFPVLAGEMGRLLGRMAELDPAHFELPSLWTDVGALSDAANGWLGHLEPYLSTADRAATRDVLRTLPALLERRPLAVCHGDYGPQNVLVVGDRVAGLLDWEDARIGDPWLDVAWWIWLVRAHTPMAFARSWRGFFDAAGVDKDDAAVEERLLALMIVRLLETAEAFRRSATGKHPSWARRLSETLRWRGAPLA